MEAAGRPKHLSESDGRKHHCSARVDLLIILRLHDTTGCQTGCTTGCIV